MRRVKSKRWDLQAQIANAARGIAGEAAWPAAAPTEAEVQALADRFEATIVEVERQEQNLKIQQEVARQELAEVVAMLRRIDFITTGLYGRDGAQKSSFGLRPIDIKPSSSGPVPQVAGLRLSDGLSGGSIQVVWKPVRRAAFEVQWFDSAGLDRLMGSAATTRAELLIPGLVPGTQIWVRVRALRAGKYGDWSETGTRIANV